MTDEDIARIAMRERQEATDRHADPHASLQDADGQGHVTGGPQHPNEIPTSHFFPRPHTQEGVSSGLSGTRPDIGELAAARSQRLLGVPVAMGPNVTKFVYAQVPEETVDGDKIRDQAFTGGRNGTVHEFDAEEAAALLCADLRKDEEEPSSCLASLSVALASRWGDMQRLIGLICLFFIVIYVSTTKPSRMCR